MDAETLSLTVTTEMAEMVRSAVAAGAYESESAMVGEVLRRYAAQLAALRDKVDEADADPTEIDDAELERHFAALAAETP